MYMQNYKNPMRTTVPPASEPTPTKNDNNISNFLSKHIGRKIKIEYDTQNDIKEIYGQLINVGSDFIVIKLPTKPLNTAVFKNNFIKKIIIIFEEQSNN